MFMVACDQRQPAPIQKSRLCWCGFVWRLGRIWEGYIVMWWFRPLIQGSPDYHKAHKTDVILTCSSHVQNKLWWHVVYSSEKMTNPHIMPPIAQLYIKYVISTTYVCMNTHRHTHRHMHTHAHTCTYTHVHTHTRTLIKLQVNIQWSLIIMRVVGFMIHWPCYRWTAEWSTVGSIIEVAIIYKRSELYFFSISCFLRVICYFQHLKNKYFGVKKWQNFRGGGGGRNFFFRKTLLSHFISCFMLFSTLNFFGGVPLHLLVKLGGGFSK